MYCFTRWMYKLAFFCYIFVVLPLFGGDILTVSLQSLHTFYCLIMIDNTVMIRFFGLQKNGSVPVPNFYLRYSYVEPDASDRTPVFGLFFFLAGHSIFVWSVQCNISFQVHTHTKRHQPVSSVSVCNLFDKFCPIVTATTHEVLLHDLCVLRKFCVGIL